MAEDAAAKESLSTKKRWIDAVTHEELEQRTLPKILKSMAPDLLIVVGDVEYYHYRYEMVTCCDFFDRVLSANMKESEESRIVLADKGPTQWPLVYKCLVNPSQVTSVLHSHYGGKRMTDTSVFCLLEWFDFLGCDDLVKKWDECVSIELKNLHVKWKWNLPSGSQYGSFQTWSPSSGIQSRTDEWPRYSLYCYCKSLPCPKFKHVLIDRIKTYVVPKLRARYDGIARTEEQKKAEQDRKAQEKEALDHYVQYLLDEECGSALWYHLQQEKYFPRDMLEAMTREEIITSPLFKYILKM